VSGASAVEVLRQHGTGAVSDALDLLGHDGGLCGLARQSGAGVTAGRAYTLRYSPVERGESGPAGDFIDDVPAGAVVVIANAGRTHCTVWGDILSEVAQLRGLAGTVIDGCCRDLGQIQALAYPLWSRGAYMKSGKNRVRLRAVQQRVELAGTLVDPGDLLCADDAGVVVVPAALAERTAALVLEVVAVEDMIRADMRRGVPLREARARHGYNRPVTVTQS
jgi:regulator of RNase E activity RraA